MKMAPGSTLNIVIIFNWCCKQYRRPPGIICITICQCKSHGTPYIVVKDKNKVLPVWTTAWSAVVFRVCHCWRQWHPHAVLVPGLKGTLPFLFCFSSMDSQLQRSYSPEAGGSACHPRGRSPQWLGMHSSMLPSGGSTWAAPSLHWTFCRADSKVQTKISSGKCSDEKISGGYKDIVRMHYTSCSFDPIPLILILPYPPREWLLLHHWKSHCL